MAQALLDRSEPAGQSPAVILLVDDDETMRCIAGDALDEPGFEVVEASNGAEAVAMFRENQPDIILMDVMMPVKDGFTACAEIRTLPGGAHTPIVMMTGLNDVESIGRAYDVGATDFITKPIHHLVLTQRVRYMLRAKNTADELRESESLLASSQRIARVGNWAWDLATKDVRVSAQLVTILGAPLVKRAESARDMCRFVHPEDRVLVESTMNRALEQSETACIEHRIVREDGRQRIVNQEIEVHSEGSGRPARLLGTIQDITERRQAEQKVRYLAYYDAVTGLPNRTLFTDQLNHALGRAERFSRSVAVMFLDLDHFKRVNDTMGHSAGDELLRLVADRLRHCLRKCDYLARGTSLDANEGDVDRNSVARLGGDEFVVMLTEVRSPGDASGVAERFINALSRPFDIDGTKVFVTCSVGISSYPGNGEDVESLLKHADAAMYHAKSEGRNQFQCYSKAINARVLESMALENSLRGALQQQEFVVYYQPKINNATGEVVSVEALVRWENPDLGLVMPNRFIPIAEATGLIVPLGDWVLRTAYEQAVAWQKDGFHNVRMSVNLSPAQFKFQPLKDTIAGILTETGLEARFLELELTESAVMEDIEASSAILSGLRALGVHISIDDFGIGYSSLSYLKRFPVDAVKIDYSFVRDMMQNADDAAIVSATIALGHSLNLSVVAEGVENQEQLSFLTANHCDESQGYLFSEPVPPNRFAQWLKARNAGGAPSGTSGDGPESPANTEALRQEHDSG